MYSTLYGCFPYFLWSHWNICMFWFIQALHHVDRPYGVAHIDSALQNRHKASPGKVCCPWLTLQWIILYTQTRASAAFRTLTVHQRFSTGDLSVVLHLWVLFLIYGHIYVKWNMKWHHKNRIFCHHSHHNHLVLKMLVFLLTKETTVSVRSLRRNTIKK